MSFIFGGNTGVSYEDLQKRRAIAQGLMQREGMRQPQYALEGLAQGAGAVVGALLDRKAGKQEGKLRDDYNSQFADMFGGGGGATATPASIPAAQGGMEQYRNAIASIESAGSGDYQAVGPTNPKLGRALGRYQIMEANIGPWSREALGREVSPDEFLANPELQDAIFDHKFGGYVQQFGPEGAAQAWFAGPGGVGKMDRQDVLGTSVGDYTQKFTSALGGPSGGSTGGGNNTQRIAQILAMMENPMASQGQKAMLGTMLQREMQAGDPMYQMQMERERLELDALRNPQAGYSQVRGADLGLTGPQADMLFNLGPDGKITQIGGGGTVVNNNMPGQDKFDDEFAKGDATALATISEAGLSARRNLGRIDQLDQLLSESGSGFGANARLIAGDLGINTEGLDDVQAARALINSLVPEQRQPGSGPMSDADLELFKQSLPRIINQPGGNQTIISTMRAIAQYDAEGAAIVQSLRAGEIDRAQAFDLLQNRANPLEGFGRAPSDRTAPTASGGAVQDFSQMSIADIGQVDVMSLTPEQMDAFDARMKELGL